MLSASQSRKTHFRDGLIRFCLQMFECTSTQWGRWHKYRVIYYSSLDWLPVNIRGDTIWKKESIP